MIKEGMPMSKLKAAVLGAGYWGAFQIPSWQAAGAEVTAVWNRTYERAVAAAERFGIPQVYASPEELFEKADFDIVDIVTAPESHLPLVLMAAGYKKAVICQKPMAVTFEDSKKMVEACRAAGVWFAVHENFRYRNAWQKIREIVLSGVLGKIIRAEINLRSASGDGLIKEPTLAKMDHMALRDMGPHVFDLTRLLFGEAKTIYCRNLASRPENGIMDTAVALLEMRSNALVKCEICTDKDPGAFISGEKGALRFDSEQYIRVYTEDSLDWYEQPKLQKPDYLLEENWRHHGGEGMLSIRKCIDSMMDSFIKGIPAPTDGEDALKTMELVFSAITSADENIACNIPEYNEEAI